MQRTKDHGADKGCPFPGERRSPALTEEDRFMELHGGRGSRTVYLTVCMIEAMLVRTALGLRGMAHLRLPWRSGAGVKTRPRGAPASARD
ncbi:hypothetical protein HPDFL43_00003340 [Hoeflea phototrophica DFL-43]|jgi:hypothetical protein|uniref:Uncharacterized protein n=1 Tax=Hoeflea phototrophica (strain DSM 17068 / NCIMB 14078 / DFL-43) TaxID=411684 RepID=A0A094Z2F3_HOEPD|nr:hypothetical protein HPDFL43_00003340 [Hoeflea phototrophica DFL-43]